MKKIFIISLIIFLIVGVLLSFYIVKNKKEIKISQGEVYQGPVRPGDNETYFRETGITKPINSDLEEEDLSSQKRSYS